MKKRLSIFFVLMIASCALLLSCQKESGGGGNNQPKKPKVGTTWTYRYYTYYSNGGVATYNLITFKAVKEETLGGEKWLKITHTGPDTVVYYLREKPDGLYQYANSSANLLCKSPAAVNDTYSSFNAGGMEDFTVKAVNQTLPTDIGDIPANFYEGKKGGNLIDEIWYNANAWIVRHQVYRKQPLAADYYKYSALFLLEIVY
jgi:hypothetical protein